MKSKLPVFLNGKKSIRVEMFWSFTLSLIMAFLLMTIVGHIIYQLQVAYYFSYLNLTLASFFIGFIVSFYLLTRRVVNYLMALVDGLQKISEGHLNYRVPILREDELGRVALHINLMTEKLERQIQKERELEKSKMELITGVSHDLRTPLTSIIGYLDLLRTNAYRDKNEYERFVQNTYNKAMHLKKLIDDLFEYTRLTSGSVNLNLRPVDVRELLEQMLFEFEPIAAEYEASITRDLGEAPAVSVIDSEKIARAIDNLLMNALKYCVKPGTIQVFMNNDEQFVYIRVKNKGVPITKEQEKKIFEWFYKIDESRRSEEIQPGTGLGLAIARNIAELHGGTVTLKHEQGWFVFIVKLPLAGNE